MSVNQPVTATLDAGIHSPGLAADQARIAWATAPRDAELDRWQELYDLAVPRAAMEAGQ